MSLRLQLLAFGALTLVLPWAGWQFVQEMEAALRTGFEQSLVASAQTVAASMRERVGVLDAEAPLPAASDRGPALYARALAAAPAVDGSRSDWGLDDADAQALPGGHRLWTGIVGDDVYLYVSVRDRDLVYQGAPGQTPYGDRVLLALDRAHGERQWLVLLTRAPGSFRAQQTAPPSFAPSGVFLDSVVAAWQQTAAGYSVEVRLPLGLIGSALGVGVVDVDRRGAGYDVSISTSWPAGRGGAGPFRHPDAELQRAVVRFGRDGDRYRVLDHNGWVLADAGDLIVGDAFESSPGLAEGLFRFALGRHDPPYSGLERPRGRVWDPALLRALRGEPVTTWYGSGSERNAIVAAAVPIESAGGVLGAVVLERASDPILTVTNRALLRLMSFTLLASVVAALGLLGFATLLSFRVRRLARAAETALGPKGEIDATLPGSKARDEIGDLARSFADLLTRLRDYTVYLRSLTSKLSHELRTPVAIVTTSLENLRHEVDGAEADVYMKRLKEGTERLDAILSAMSEATRIEQAIGETVVVSFDLAAVLESCCKAYGDLYGERRIVYRSGLRGAAVAGSPELIAQMMDKLIDNAVSFSPPASAIEITLGETPTALVLSVVNRGSSLPETMRRQLFDSLVSVRNGNDGRAHLGLGLYVVALIVEFHRGRIEANNLADGSGVEFRIEFPRQVPPGG